MRQISLWVKKKMVLVPLATPFLPWASWWISLLIAGTQKTFKVGSCCNFLYCVMVSFVIGCTTPKQSSVMLMMGPVHCELVATFMASSVMTWCIAWMEMFPGMRGWMIMVERCGGGGTWLVGWVGWSLSGLMTVYRCGMVMEIGHTRLWRPRRMLWMITAGVSFGETTVGIGINNGLACWKPPGRCIGGCCIGVGLAVGRRGSSRSGRGALGLQLPCPTVSSSSLSSWKGLLLPVTL
jgi:hypothetical protein